MARPSMRRLERFMTQADSYEEWRQFALEHDRRSGMQAWKEEPCSKSFDHESIHARLQRLRELREAGDDHGILFTLNEGIHGNLGGMGRAALYEKAKFGTKQLITDYIDEVVSALEHIAAVPEEVISADEKLDFFRRARHCYGQSALMLSGGAVLGNFHLGVVRALLLQDLLPTVISGSSAGSVVAGILATHDDANLRTLFDAPHLLAEAREEARGFQRILGTTETRMHEDDLIRLVERLVPDMTFAEAYQVSGRQINITIAPAEIHQKSRLLNAITSPNVFIRSAIMASCAIPGLFPPVTLEARSIKGKRQPYLSRRKWVDGSVSEDLPAKRLARLYGVNHYIASQTNPFALLFVGTPKLKCAPLKAAKDIAFGTVRQAVKSYSTLLERQLTRFPRGNLMVNMSTSVLTQEYTADINIIPPYRLIDPRKLLYRLTEREILTLIRAGEQATWPKIEMIRNCSKISRILFRLLDQMESRSRQIRLLPV